jgi:hypothetical protein
MFKRAYIALINLKLPEYLILLIFGSSIYIIMPQALKNLQDIPFQAPQTFPAHWVLREQTSPQLLNTHEYLKV